MKCVKNHIIFDIKLKNKISIQELEKVFDNIVNLLSLNVLIKENHIFENGWFTLFYVLSESHISAHYRIEQDYLALDIYSCRNMVNYEKNILEYIKLLNTIDIKINYLNRTI